MLYLFSRLPQIHTNVSLEQGWVGPSGRGANLAARASGSRRSMVWASLCKSGSTLTVGLGNLMQFSKPQFMPLENGHNDACHLGDLCMSQGSKRSGKSEGLSLEV